MKSQYLRVCMMPGPEHEHGDKADRVNVHVPMTLIRAPMKFTSLLPPEARDKVNGALHEKGIDFDMRNLKPEVMAGLLEALSDLEVDAAGSDGEQSKFLWNSDTVNEFPWNCLLGSIFRFILWL
jgi:hypothetical protein